METNPSRIRRDLKHLGDLSRSQLLPGEEPEDLAVVGTQPPQCRIQLAIPAARLGAGVDTGRQEGELRQEPRRTPVRPAVVGEHTSRHPDRPGDLAALGNGVNASPEGDQHLDMKVFDHIRLGSPSKVAQHGNRNCGMYPVESCCSKVMIHSKRVMSRSEVPLT
ncbi:MAG: hypothetical protein RL006_351 [Chloroflexota bacterium]